MRINNEPAPRGLSFNFSQIKQELQIADKKTWKYHVCELHYQYNELIFWIYMFNREDIYNCYNKVVDIYNANIGDFCDIDVNAYFYARANEKRFYHFSFLSTEDFLKARTEDGPLNVDIYDLVGRSVLFIND